MMKLFCSLGLVALVKSLPEDNPKYLRKSLSNNVHKINRRARTTLTEDEEEFWQRELASSNSLSSLSYSYNYDSKEKKYVPSKSSSRNHSNKEPVDHGESIITFHKSKVDLIKMLDLIKSVHEYKESLAKSNLLKKKDSNDSKRASKNGNALKKTTKKKSHTTSVASNHNKSNNNKAHNQKSSTNGTKKTSSSKMKEVSSSSPKSTSKETYEMTSNTTIIEHVHKTSVSSISALTPPPIAIPKEIFQVLSSSTKEERDDINVSSNKASNDEITTKTGCSKIKSESLQKVIKNKVSGDGKVFNNPNSPQSKAMNWIFSNSAYMIQKDYHNDDTITYCPKGWIQRYSTVVLYYSLGGENWHDKNEFLIKDKHECEWNKKIICNDKNNEIIEIIIGNNNMEGTIPNEIGMLNKLNTLSLTNGKILGPIPDTMYNIQTLETLQLNNNEITGELPNALYTMKNLKILHFNNNKLRGRIQSDIGLLGNSLMSLRLDNNYFDGLIRRELKDLVRLRDGTFHNNTFTGRIPSRMCNLFEPKSGGNLSYLTSDCGDSNKVTCDCCTMCY